MPSVIVGEQGRIALLVFTQTSQAHLTRGGFSHAIRGIRGGKIDQRLPFDHFGAQSPFRELRLAVMVESQQEADQRNGATLGIARLAGLREHGPKVAL